MARLALPSRLALAGGLAALTLTFVPYAGARSDGVELVPAPQDLGARFGDAVSVDGDTAVIGAPNQDHFAMNAGNGGLVLEAGGVQVYRRDAESGTWPQERTLIPDTPQQNEHFGSSVGVDGDVLVAGATGHTTGSPDFVQSGGAYVFTRSGAIWSQAQVLEPSDGNGNDQFGYSIAIDGDTAVVGAPFHGTIPDGAPTSFFENGQVYVFRFNGETWVESQILFASDAFDGQNFGVSVDIDGDRIVVGAPGVEELPAKGPNPSGPGVYVFERSGGPFQETCKVRPGEVGDFDDFGASVDIQGNRFIVGAPETPSDADSGTFFGAGAAYVFQYDGNDDDWPLEQRLVSQVQTTGYAFGYAVGIHGSRLVVGSPGWSLGGSVGGFEEGVIELFQFSGDGWDYVEDLERSIPNSQDHFGAAIAMDAQSVVGGAPNAVIGENSESGAAVVFAVGGNVPPPNTVRAFILPKSVKFTPSPVKKAKPTVVVKATFDSGPDTVDFTAPATLTLAGAEIELTGLTSVKGGKKFTYDKDGLKLTIKPSKIGSSKGKLSLTTTVPVVGDADGPFEIRYEGGGVNALGVVQLENGKFRFGKKAGAILAPDMNILKAKANLPGRGRHAFKFVAGFTTEGPFPTQAPDISVAYGSIYSVAISGDELKSKGNGKFVFKGNQGGIREIVLDYRKERLAVRGTGVDLGDVSEGPQPLLVILTRDDDVRAVLVRAARRKKDFRY